MVATEHSKCFDSKGRAGSTPAAGTALWRKLALCLLSSAWCSISYHEVVRRTGFGNKTKGVTGFDLARKIKQQSVVVGSTLKADNQLNGTDEIDAAMANFDVEIARILDAELVTV